MEKNWFLLNRHKLGSGAFILKYIIIPITTLRSGLYAASYNLSLYPFMVDLASYSALAVFAVAPALRDPNSFFGERLRPETYPSWPIT